MPGQPLSELLASSPTQHSSYAAGVDSVAHPQIVVATDRTPYGAGMSNINSYTGSPVNPIQSYGPSQQQQQQPSAPPQPTWAVTASITFHMVMTALQCACQIYMAVYGTYNTIRMVASLRHGIDNYQHSGGSMLSPSGAQQAIEEFGKALMTESSSSLNSRVFSVMKKLMLLTLSILLADSLYKYIKHALQDYSVAQTDESLAQRLAEQVSVIGSSATASCQDNSDGARRSSARLHLLLTHMKSHMQQEEEQPTAEKQHSQNHSFLHRSPSSFSFILSNVSHSALGSIGTLVSSVLAYGWPSANSFQQASGINEVQQQMNESSDSDSSEVDEDEELCLDEPAATEATCVVTDSPLVSSHVTPQTLRRFPNNTSKV